jgi:hypothetical protein
MFLHMFKLNLYHTMSVSARKTSANSDTQIVDGQ